MLSMKLMVLMFIILFLVRRIINMEDTQELINLLNTLNFNIEILKNAFLLFFGVILAIFICYLCFKVIDNFISF